MAKQSQVAKVWNYMVNNGSVSGLEAMQHLHVYRLSDVIFKMRNMGVEIITERVEFTDADGEKNNYGRYFISPNNKVIPA